MSGLVVRESPVEYFKAMVEAAMLNQHVNAQELTTFYLVNLLARFAAVDSGEEEVLCLRLVRALQSSGLAQRDGLRRVGDVSLFVSGFFSDSLNRSLVDVDYYIALGERAYGSLGQIDDDTFTDVFSELSGRFVRFVDVLTEVSERARLTSNVDILRLYERWSKVPSRRLGHLLAAHGIIPNRLALKPRVQ